MYNREKRCISRQLEMHTYARGYRELVDEMCTSQVERSGGVNLNRKMALVGRAESEPETLNEQIRTSCTYA